MIFLVKDLKFYDVAIEANRRINVRFIYLEVDSRNKDKKINPVYPAGGCGYLACN